MKPAENWMLGICVCWKCYDFQWLNIVTSVGSKLLPQHCSHCSNMYFKGSTLQPLSEISSTQHSHQSYEFQHCIYCYMYSKSSTLQPERGSTLQPERTQPCNQKGLSIAVTTMYAKRPQHCSQRGLIAVTTMYAKRAQLTLQPEMTQYGCHWYLKGSTLKCYEF